VSSDADAVGLRSLAADDDALIDRLWQLYVHDLSESRGSLPNADGLFKMGHLAWYRGQPDQWSGCLVTYKGAPAGFAFIGLAWEGDKRTIGDFFVVRGVRRRGVGFKVARELISRYPGTWEIAFQAHNPGAPEFWREVVGSLVGDAWTEELRPVPDKPQIPPDHWLVFTTDLG
jgi:predicted acetyltransferase